MKNIIKIFTITVATLAIITIEYNVQAENIVVNEVENNIEENVEENTNIENTNTPTETEKQPEDDKEESKLTGVSIDGKALSNGDKISVDNDVSSVRVQGIGESLYNIYINGKNNQGFTVNLQEGENTILVRGESGTEIKVIVNRKEAEKQVEEEKEDTTVNTVDSKVETTETNKELGLSSLSIENVELSPKFSNTIYSYTVNINENINAIKINAVANTSDAKIIIDGVEDLKDGENIVNIIVSSEKTGETKIYQIMVNKKIGAISNINIPYKYIIIGVVGAILLIIIIILIMKKRKANISNINKSSKNKSKGKHS